jgi:parvulin-like peptidyl-prolyl isomerase
MRRLLPLLLALVVLGSACSAFGEAPAATVAGTEISTESIDDEMDTIRANTEYKQALEQSYGSPTDGAAGKGTFDAAFVAQILSLRVWYQMIEEDITDRGLEITDAILEQATSEIQQQFAQLDPDPTDEANPVLDAFPKSYRDRLIRQRALIDTVDAEIVESIGDDERTFYDENTEDFAEICVSHILVGVQGGRTPAEAKKDAQELYARIQDGEDFEDIAANESDDPAAAAEGGSLGCGSRLSLQFDPVFLGAAFALEVDEVSEPVLTQFGAHLILVTSREIPSYREVEDQVSTVMQQAHDLRINEYLVKVICGTDVKVNPRYGTWTAETCEGPAPQLPSVQPPEGPRVKTVEDPAFEL